MTVLDIARIVTAELRKHRKTPKQSGKPLSPEVPTVECTATSKGDWQFLCEHCAVRHVHGAADVGADGIIGHRRAHCTVDTSPYLKGGYILRARAPQKQAVPDLSGRPELQKDANGLWPGQQHPLDIPDFLRRTPRPPTSSEAPQREAAP
jgi:hypothetical protein